MAADNQTLPEGTDTIIAGAGVGDDDSAFDTGTAAADFTSASATSGAADGNRSSSTGSDGADAQGASADGVRDQLFGRYEALRGQAGDKARDLVQTGKDRATSAIDDVVRMIEDAAAEVDDKIGSQYGDYARRAADGLSGFSDSFKDKDVDELFDQARALIAKSPAAAAGIAAVLGFVAARMVRSGLPENPGASASPAGDASQA
ncbi:hypothetical protein [uncultured Sphingomonas sp.]|uniref:hypothetical protein n=1 Tax=uncultured Sphingomonas sp. TaxID=158754 RepID=UPI0025E75FA1|nr:hypothetical protein [uncultured Sphingomonas sp.]